MPKQRILLLNGPNLDMLGMREPEVYGRKTLGDLEEMVVDYAQSRGVEVTCFQSNSESALVDKIHRAGTYDGVVYNPGAHTHYSYALRDAVAAIDVPVIEVHISDIDSREAFRKISVIAPVCVGQVKGLGFEGYCRALDILCEDRKLYRLGEDYAKRYPESQSIIIGVEQVATKPAEKAGDDRGRKWSAKAAIESVAVPVSGSRPAKNQQEEASAMAQPEQQSQEGQRIGCEQLSQSVPQAQVAAHMQPMQQNAQAHQEMKLQVPTQAQMQSQQPQPVQQVPMLQVQLPQLQMQPQPQAQPPKPQVQPHPQAQIPQPQQPPAGSLQDFTAPYAQVIAEEESGLISFERQGLVRKACEQFGLAGLLVRDTSNIRWITAFDGVFDEERAHALLVTRGGSALHTDSRYSNALRTVARRISSDIVISDERITHAQFAAGALASEGGAPAGALGIEDSITYAEFAKMVEVLGVQNLSATTDVVLGLRAVKTRSEIARLLAAQAVTDAAFKHIVSYIRPGMTEREVQLELEDFMLRHGGEGLAFSSIVATGANGADPHAIPGKTRLEAGQCMVMDFGAKAYGYCSDMTRTVLLGQPSAKLAGAWDVLRCANETVERTLRPGVTGRQAHELAERVLADGGFAGRMGHGLGHGVGIDVHELPVLNTRNDMPLVAGNVVTVEPGIYVPGDFGMRLEDCGVITDHGYEVFSQLGHDMVIL